MNVNIIALGKLKEDFLIKAGSEYEKRLSAYCKLNIIELTPAKLSKNPSASEISSTLEKEAMKITTKTPKSYKIVLAAEGQRMTSESFADRLLAAGSDVTFIIGSSEGLAESVKSNADLKLSLSEMTFPHKLARIMLLEQIYRAFSIQNNKKYHK